MSSYYTVTEKILFILFYYIYSWSIIIMSLYSYLITCYDSKVWRLEIKAAFYSLLLGLQQSYCMPHNTLIVNSLSYLARNTSYSHVIPLSTCAVPCIFCRPSFPPVLTIQHDTHYFICYYLLPFTVCSSLKYPHI